MKEHNIIGTMQLLAACQAAPRAAQAGRAVVDRRVRCVVPRPGRLHRVDAAHAGAPRRLRQGRHRDRGVRARVHAAPARRRPPPCCGSRRSSARTRTRRLTRYFALPVVPTVFGRDPRLQFIHVDDALEVLVRSVVENHQGTFNVAGAGRHACCPRRSGGPVGSACRCVEPGMSAFAAFVKASGIGDFNLDQLDLFVHGRVVDTTPADRGVRLPAAQHGTRRSTTSSRGGACTARAGSRRCGRTRSRPSRR